MVNILPQQQLFLELLMASGDIAVGEDNKGTILGRTMKECIQRGWTENKTFGGGFNKVAITEQGRKVAAETQAN